MKNIKSEDIFDAKKITTIASELASLNSGIIVFGLPHSGKSTLVRAICSKDKRFKTLDEEEILSDEDARAILQKSKTFWCVSHQFPGQNQDVSEDYLRGFCEGVGLNQKEWLIVKIVK